METSITRRTQAATERRSVLASAASLAALILAVAPGVSTTVAAQGREEPLYLDLTTPPPIDQQGLGVPGGEAGTFGPSKYELPLQIDIISGSVNAAGNLILQVRLKNTGESSFDLPISRNISDVQRTPGGSRRQFVFAVRPTFPFKGELWTVAVTAGSTSVPHSLSRLQPGGSAQVLLRVESGRTKGAMPKGTKQFGVEVVCHEWTLYDDRYSVRAASQDLISSNAATFQVKDGMAVSPYP